MKRKTSLMILMQGFPPDIRVEKEAEALTESGYDVYIVATHRRGNPTRNHGAKTIYIGKPLRSFDKAILSIFKTIPLYEAKIIKRLKEINIKPNIIHVHDLPWAYLGYRVAKKFGVPFIIDFHENYPAAIQIWRQKWFEDGTSVKRLFKNVIIKPLFFNLKKWREYEIDMIKQSDAFIVVVDEALERFPDYLKNKAVIVSNTEDPSEWRYYGYNKSRIFEISYVGGVEYHRGLHVLIKAVGLLKRDGIDNIRLSIIGPSDKSYMKLLNEIIRKWNLEGVITYEKWVEYRDIHSKFKNCSLCAIPHLKNEHTDTTIPHKLFQYMAMGKPVIVSNAKPLKRIVSEANCGVVYESNDPISAAEAIRSIKGFHKILEKFGINARKAVETKYNWNEDKKRLLDLYNRLTRT